MKYMIKKSHIKLLLFFLSFHFLATFLLSCSQVTPEVISPEYSVIFEYEDEKSNPKARMSIFVESLTDVNRYERIRVYCENGGYIWDFNEIATFTNKNRSWTGNTNLKMPQNQIFPSGKYELIFYNADEKDTSVQLNVNYDSSFYKLTSTESENLLKNKNAIKKIVIYDKNHQIIYFGEKSSSFDTPRRIWNTFSNAKYYQDILITPGNYVICIMPEKEVSLENQQ